MKNLEQDLGRICPKNSSFKLHNKFYPLFEILCDIDKVKAKRKITYLNTPSVFDIEASSFYNDNNEKRCCMYAWVFGINGKCCRGRTWNEFFEALETVKRYYNLGLNNRIIIYVHNLAYEFQWFRKYFEWDKIFALDTRKPVYAITKDGIEFRCSYLMSGYSLQKLGENLTKYRVNKMVGDLDYSLIRHSQTPLSEKEWGYILNDGLVVMAHIQEEIERLGSIKEIPLTKTGYVRNLCRENCLKGANRWEFISLIKSLTLTPETYKQLKRTYMGGFTHANINYVGEVMENVHSFDFSSSYPAVQVSERYPMSAPFELKPKTYEEFEKFLKCYCCMFECTFTNLTAKVTYENYISVSRCIKAEHYILNNGRIIEANLVQISLTEQDFKIISQLYEWDEIEIINMMGFYKGYLPKDFILTILELYKDKTELKGVEEKLVEYMVSKGMINSMYGMCVTDPCKDDNIYDGNWSVSPANIDELIDKYNNDRQRFLYYAWGVWVTAYARANLFSGIIEFKDDYIYSDTDSIKVLNKDKHKEYIDNYNKEIKRKVENCLKWYNIPLEMAYPKTIKGIVKPLGVWDYEGMYTRFKTLGAKRYMVEKDGEISITIAGVGKDAGIKYLKHKFGSNDDIFNNFTDSLHFPSHYDRDGIDENGSGKLLHTYIDFDMNDYIIDYLGNKYVYSERSGVHMENTEYSLSLDKEFLNLIMGIKGGHIIC